jgi:hypothetical protein
VRVVGAGNLGLTPSAGVDCVDVALGIITLQACQARVGDPFAVGRIGRAFAVRHFGLTTPADVDRVDRRRRQGGASVSGTRIGYLLALGREGRSVVFHLVVGDLDPTVSASSCSILVTDISNYTPDWRTPRRSQMATLPFCALIR